ncbi:MAG: PAS domain S-box protein [Treponema sp.]|jgi:PAS domain S-box-containing protein|nr:PAS domain S-box protein [Treponema sp.]
MRDFIKRALTKLNKLTPAQVEELLNSAAEEVSRLETVIDSLTDGILVLDENHCLIMANKFAERILPFSKFEGSPAPVWKAVQDERVVEFFQESLISGDRVVEREIDVEYMGVQRLLSISILPLVENFRITGSLIYIEDITEKRGREARLRRAENLASLTTLAAGVAHEIKNPLGSISIHIQLIQKVMDANKKLYFQAHPEESMESEVGPVKYFHLFDRYLDVVNEEIDRLNHIVVDFLFAVRPMTLEPREGDINKLVSDLADFVSLELEKENIACHLDLDRELPLLHFDERYLKQALLNLIKNSQAAMKGGGELFIKTERQDQSVLIHIKDTGTGISEANLSKIFEPYFTTRDAGSGLGLTLVFKIVKEHQGEITVKSREGEGASFTISLPVLQKEQKLLSYEGMES